MKAEDRILEAYEYAARYIYLRNRLKNILKDGNYKPSYCNLRNAKRYIPKGMYYNERIVYRAKMLYLLRRLVGEVFAAKYNPVFFENKRLRLNDKDNG